MKTEYKVIILSIVFGLLVWMVDAVIDYFIFYAESFGGSLIYDISSHNIYMRSFIILSFLIFGILISRILVKRKRAEERIKKISRLKEDLLSSSSLDEKLKHITDGVVEIFDADFSRIWITKPGDLCDSGCMHAKVTEGPHICKYRDRCLNLITSSGRYTHIDGKVHRRVPFGCYKIGCVAAGKDPKFLTNDVTHDPRVHDHEWARKIGLVAFAGYRLLSDVRKPIGVLALFSKYAISPDEDSMLEVIANTTSQVIQATWAEEELIKTKEHLDNTIESSLDGIVTGDSKGNIVSANEAFLKLTGYHKEEMKEMHIMELSITEKGTYESTTGESVEIDEEFFNDARKMTYEKLFKEGKIINWETYYLRKDRRIVPVEQNIVYLYNEEEDITGSVGIIRDITERRKAEKKIKEAGDFLENIFKTTADGILVTDNEGLIIMVNSAAEKILGYSKEEIIGKGADIFKPEGEQYEVTTKKYLTKFFEEGVVTAFELTWLKKDGNLVGVEVNAALIKDDKGNITGSVASLRDTTERKQADEELVKLATAIKQAHETVVILGTDGIITYVNPALEEQMGYSSSELIGTNFISFDRSSDQQHLFQKIWKTINEGNIWTGHMSPRSKDGSIREFDLTISPIRDQSGKITSFVSIARNVTKELEMEERLHQAEKMEAIGTLAGGVAHDLNNVLGGIVGYPDLLLHDIPEDSPMRSSLMAIKQSGQRASAIVQDLLTLARRGVQITEAVNLNTILTRCLESVEYKRLEEFHPDVKIETEFEKDLLNILGSQVHLSKTVMNLLSNASEAMPGGGKITISSENRYLDKPIKGYDRIKEGDYVVLSVKDNGIGIASEDLEKIFEPFYTKKVMGRSGTGLGMAVVWGTVKDHQGYIDVKSIEGQGTTFTLYFPVTRKEIEGAKEPVSIEEYSGNGEKILVVDDVEAQRDIAANLLKKLNYNVETVASGEEAVDYMRNNIVYLLVLDMIMDPGIDGLDTYKRIIEINPGQKAIIASGFSETDHVREAQKLGAGAYIRKPYTLEKIGLTVKTELESQT